MGFELRDYEINGFLASELQPIEELLRHSLFHHYPMDDNGQLRPVVGLCSRIRTRHRWLCLANAFCCIRPPKPIASGAEGCQMELTGAQDLHYNATDAGNASPQKDGSDDRKELDHIANEELLGKTTGLLRSTGIEYRPSIGKIITPEHWWECKIKENPKYVKYKHMDCREIYDIRKTFQRHRRLV
ncbi:Hypothetical predicted protein [Olea europaea subsp. europaea]|uniref:Uncharacterized protein n=1 Tax=Olea europaea subsp. europaea TaxID=158383 RepID=A0A8S0RCT3_OLEEU|nr:Hypothetical predicted protein [Olea europaea subsp. europaea]